MSYPKLTYNNPRNIERKRSDKMGKIIRLAGIEVMPGEKFQDFITVPGTEYKTPVTIVNGKQDGRTIYISTGVHGGEYPGVAVVSEVSSKLSPEEVSGAVIFTNCLNYSGMTGMYDAVVPEDGENINRKFPGSPEGTVTDRIRDFIVREIYPQVEFIADLHSGGAYESLSSCVFFPAACGQEMRELVLDVCKHIDIPYLVASTASDGLYSYGCHHGVPGMILERGGHGECDPFHVEGYKRDLKNILIYFGLLNGEYEPVSAKKTVFEHASYIGTDVTGFWYPEIELDTEFKKGDRLGLIKDIFGNTLKEFIAEHDGKVLYYNGALVAIENWTNIVAYGWLE